MPQNLIYTICILPIAVIGLWFPQFQSSSPNATETLVSSQNVRNLHSSVTTIPEAPIFPTASPEETSNKLPAGAESERNPLPTDYQSLEEMNGLLADGRYERAVQFYSDMYDLLSEAESEIYRETILSAADTLVSLGDHGTLISLLEEYTSVFIKDIDALRMLAISQHALEDYVAEIDTLFLAL